MPVLLPCFAANSCAGPPPLTPPLSPQLHCRTPPADSETPNLLISGGEDGRLATWCFSDRFSPPKRLLHLRVGGGRLTSLSLSPCGGTVAAGMVDSSIRLFSVVGGVQLATLRGHTTWVSRLVFFSAASPSSEEGAADADMDAPPPLRLLSGAYEGDVRVWDVARGTGQEGGHLPALLGGATDAGGVGGANGREHRDCAEHLISALLPLPDRPLPPTTDAPHSRAAAAVETCTYLAAASMGGAIRLWDTRLSGSDAILSEYWPVGPRGDPAYHLAQLRCAPSQGLCTLLSSHRSGALRATRVVPDAGAEGALQPLYCVAGAHSDWATQLVPHPAAGRAVFFSCGEDGWVKAWRGVPPPSWSRHVHGAYPDGFRAAVKTLLLVLHRLGGDEAAEEAGAEAAAAAARGRRQIFRSYAAAAAAAVPAQPLMARAWLFGVTRDAIVDAVVARLAERSYPQD